MPIVFTILFLLFSLHPGGDYIHWQWAACISVTSIPICSWIRKRTSTAFSLLCAYCIVRSSFTVFPLINVFNKGGDVYRLNVSMASAVGFISAAVLMACFLLSKRSWYKQMIPAIAAYGVINSVYVIAGYCFGFGKFPMGVGYSGFLDYSGMNGGLIAICTIALFQYFKSE